MTSFATVSQVSASRKKPVTLIRMVLKSSANSSACLSRYARYASQSVAPTVCIRFSNRRIRRRAPVAGVVEAALVADVLEQLLEPRVG